MPGLRLAIVMLPVGARALVPGQGATGLVVAPTTDVLIARRWTLLTPEMQKAPRLRRAFRKSSI